jgi:hypothetical protein
MQVAAAVLPQVADDVRAEFGHQGLVRLQVVLTHIGDGAKKGACRAVQKVAFCCGEGADCSVAWCACCCMLGQGTLCQESSPIRLVSTHACGWHGDHLGWICLEGILLQRWLRGSCTNMSHRQCADAWQMVFCAVIPTASVCRAVLCHTNSAFA